MVDIRLSHSKQPPSVTTPINVAMPKSIVGTNHCNRPPTPSPIAIQTPILKNTMSRNYTRECTSFSVSLAPDGPLARRLSRGLPLIMVMEAANFRQDHHGANCRWRDRSGMWAIHRGGKSGR